MIDVVQRINQLQEQEPALRLYALVDGIQYEKHRQTRLKRTAGLYPLFAGTPDAALSHAGAWLIEAAISSPARLDDLAALERETPSVTWLVAVQDLHGLAQLLQLNLNAQLPDGRTALLRFWDPRVLVSLAGILDATQREAMFGHIYEWNLLHDGKRATIGRNHADV